MQRRIHRLERPRQLWVLVLLVVGAAVSAMSMATQTSRAEDFPASRDGGVAGRAAPSHLASAASAPTAGRTGQTASARSTTADPRISKAHGRSIGKAEGRSKRKPDRRRSADRQRTRTQAPRTGSVHFTGTPERSFEPQGPGLSVLVVGDSLAVGVGMTLESAFQGHSRVTMKKMGKISTGLDSPRFYDWNSVLREALSREKYDVVVVMLGANDAHNSPGDSAWARRYEAKFSDLLKIPAEKQVRTVVVGLPPMRKDDFCQRVRLANEAIRNASSAHAQTCTYVDSFSRFADEDGNFTDRIRLRGEWRTVRAGDGVHFTGTGYQVLGRMVASEALQR